MMRVQLAVAIGALLLAVALPGCAGSRPADTVPLAQRGEPAPTLADATMQKKIMSSIAQGESTCGATDEPKLVETRRITQSDEKVEEAWVVTRGADRAAYRVTLVHGSQTDFFVSGRCR